MPSKKRMLVSSSGSDLAAGPALRPRSPLNCCGDCVVADDPPGCGCGCEVANAPPGCCAVSEVDVMLPLHWSCCAPLLARELSPKIMPPCWPRFEVFLSS